MPFIAIGDAALQPCQIKANSHAANDAWLRRVAVNHRPERHER
ncbi:hypothetical protein ACFSQT_19930 [Mesorhizobium calcicola]|uniref:Uncharacterized protein n=1 Tax=Mesorhizobium calcicola TaxID=1300310 RepID=A0ABW4WIH7_9HYPH